MSPVNRPTRIDFTQGLPYLGPVIEFSVPMAVFSVPMAVFSVPKAEYMPAGSMMGVGAMLIEIIAC